jgi:hypothetical protein
MVAGAHYYTATGPLTTTRETESQKNNRRIPANGRGVEAVVSSAKSEGSKIAAD